MDIITIAPALFSILGTCIAAYAMYKSTHTLKDRLRIEKKLANNLAAELKKRNIESIIDVELNKLIVQSEIGDKDIQELKTQIDDAVKLAIQKLLEDERCVVRQSLEQPSKQGQIHYLNKIINNSLQVLSHQKA